MSNAAGAACAGMTGRDRAREIFNTTASESWMPVGAAEHRSQFGSKRAALSELDLLADRRGKSCEFGERPNWREAQGIPH